jgi:AP-1-like factor
VNDLNFLASQGNFQFDPQIFGDYREPQDNVLANGTFDDNFFNDAFDVDFTTPYNISMINPAGQKQDSKMDLISQIDAAKNADDEVVDGNGQDLACSKIWYDLNKNHLTIPFTHNRNREKLQACPKVQEGDFDLDGLCADLQKKAKCSGSGPVVNQKDFTSIMQKYLGKTHGETAGCGQAFMNA